MCGDDNRGIAIDGRGMCSDDGRGVANGCARELENSKNYGLDNPDSGVGKVERVPHILLSVCMCTRLGQSKLYLVFRKCCAFSVHTDAHELEQLNDDDVVSDPDDDSDGSSNSKSLRKLYSRFVRALCLTWIVLANSNNGQKHQ